MAKMKDLLIQIEDMGYCVIDQSDVTKLRRIKDRLYDGRIMTYDERRDLASVIDGILDSLVEVHGQA